MLVLDKDLGNGQNELMATFPLQVRMLADPTGAFTKVKTNICFIFQLYLKL